MNTTSEAGVALAQGICRAIGALDSVETILCPPFVSLWPISGVVHNTNVSLGAQNVNEKPSGALTGEISASMLQGIVTHVIVGHSERRANFAETDAQVAAKVSALCEAGLTPILCVGEDSEERNRGRAERFVRRQLRNSVGDPSHVAKSIIAYEPVWAIGTGTPATIGQIEYMVASIREELGEICDEETASQTRIIYGGSTNPDNIGEITNSKSIDGALVGGASLVVDDFVAMVQSLARTPVSH